MATQKAPGTLEVVQDFVNTWEIDEDADEIDGPDGLRAWLADRSLVPAEIPVTEDDVRAAHALRESIRKLLAANAGESLDPSALAVLNDAAAAGGVGPLFTSHDEVSLQPSAPGARGGLGRIVAFAVDAVAAGTWPRLKACLNDECQWAFYDSARNRSAKWCSMAVCGNRNKARAFRARQSESER
ncbi:MAG: CGNR zinc finger domain-containing protein [Actinomycetota bacterium]